MEYSPAVKAGLVRLREAAEAAKVADRERAAETAQDDSDAKIDHLVQLAGDAQKLGEIALLHRRQPNARLVATAYGGGPKTRARERHATYGWALAARMLEGRKYSAARKAEPIVDNPDTASLRANDVLGQIAVIGQDTRLYLVEYDTRGIDTTAVPDGQTHSLHEMSATLRTRIESGVEVAKVSDFGLENPVLVTPDMSEAYLRGLNVVAIERGLIEFAEDFQLF